MEVICNIDNSYLRYCVVMLVSLFKNNKEESFNVHVISSRLSDEGHAILTQCAQYYGHTLTCYSVGSELLAHCPTTSQSHLSISTYYRIFLPAILPQNIDKILYLDSDIVVRGSIKKLWETDISNYAVAGVEDMCSALQENYSRLHYSPKDSYFNAGVLLINLKYWREHNIQAECEQFIMQNSTDLPNCDQDVLNGVLHDQKLLLPFKWNMQDGFFRRKRMIHEDSWAQLDHEMGDPVILHYTGSKKPWHYTSGHPFKSEYYKYLDLTIWKGERPPVNRIVLWRHRLRALLYLLQLDRPHYRKIK